ncbi:MAG: hypothetical protein J7498_01290 [Sphingobium sp.]|nr:hypothetical protein [Sphingobium sp.]
MPKYRVMVQAAISVVVDIDDAELAVWLAERFAEWLSPTIEQIDQYCDVHEGISTDTGPLTVEGGSIVEEIGE